MAAWSNNHLPRSDQCFYDELSINSLYSGSDGQLRQVIDPTMTRKNALLRTSVTVKQRQEEFKTSHPWVENPGRPSSTRGPSSRSKSPYNKTKSISGTGDSVGRTTRIERDIDKKEKRRSMRSGAPIHPSNQQKSCHGHLCYESGESVYDNDEEDKLSKSSRNSIVSKNSLVQSTNSKHSKTKFSSPTTVQSVAALSVAAIAGGLILGPVGVLLGTGALACAGIYHSLPEEQRQQILEDTDRTCKRTYEWGERMSDRLGTSCATVFEKTGDLVGCDTPPNTKRGSRATSFGDLPSTMLLSSQFQNALNREAASDDNEENENEGCLENNKSKSHFAADKMNSDYDTTAAINRKIESNGLITNERQSQTINSRHDQKFHRNRSIQQQSTSTSRGKMTAVYHVVAFVWLLSYLFIIYSSLSVRLLGSFTVLALQAVSVSHIHALTPSLQPQAWLEVICHEFSSKEEIKEAMEEIVLYAKDKHHGRMFLEEGILDPLLAILKDFFDVHAYLLKLKEEEPAADETRVLLQEACELYQRAQLAANICIALGKAHCALVHTEGDLLLMSSYHQGRVPEGRQLAQMLYEVPHRTRDVWPLNNSPVSAELFAANKGGRRPQSRLTELSLNQAEELAKMIKDLTEGRMNPLFSK
jgi:hypothetical protein